MNSEDLRKLKIGIGISAFTVVFYLVLSNIDKLAIGGNYLLALFSVYAFGICFAFIINIILVFLEDRLFVKLKAPKIQRFKRPICLTLSIIIFFGIIIAVVMFIVPQLTKSIAGITQNFDQYSNTFLYYANKVSDFLGTSKELSTMLQNIWEDVMTYITSFAKNFMQSVVSFLFAFTSTLANFLLGFIVAIYMLISKEKLIFAGKKVTFAIFPKNVALYLNRVYRLISKTFTKFVAGQFTEALIVGVLCFIGMNIFSMKYSLLISTIIALTNMLPIIGPILGALLCFLLMLVADPTKAIWFLVFILVLQQIEGNVIYPKVVGGSIGLPPLLVTFAIIVGGTTFGFVGILLGVPAMAVIYLLIRDYIDNVLKKKNIDVTKI